MFITWLVAISCILVEAWGPHQTEIKIASDYSDWAVLWGSSSSNNLEMHLFCLRVLRSFAKVSPEKK